MIHFVLIFIYAIPIFKNIYINLEIYQSLKKKTIEFVPYSAKENYCYNFGQFP